MRRSLIILILITAALNLSELNAQIDSIFVEKYYITDSKDETDTYGGGLPAGSVTYRIYIDLKENSVLKRVYGDAFHQIRIESTESFFNHTDRGKSIGKEISSSRLNQGTLPLDTWVTYAQASNEHTGVFKSEDPDGSIIGGSKNDGGSEKIPGGLLVNSNPAAGIPLTTADGMIKPAVLPSNLTVQLNGKNLVSSTDTTIFGAPKRRFASNNFSIVAVGNSLASASNRILVAQLTTKGELSFELNIEVEEVEDVFYTKTVKYVASNPQGIEKTNRFLTYPPVPPACGCKDPDYLEFDKALECHNQDSCKTPVVIGCTDPSACNYDPAANLNVQELCCYPGRCYDRDINVVCPDLKGTEPEFTIYPNPVQDNLTLKILNGNQRGYRYSVFDSNGTALMTENLGWIEEHFEFELNISCLPKGYYIIGLQSEGRIYTRSFIKK